MKIIKRFLFILLFCMLSFSCENQFEQKKSTTHVKINLLMPDNILLIGHFHGD